MKVFCSWSGDYSRAVASAVGEWIPLVVQQAKIFVSDHSLDPGDRWSSVIADALNDYDFGLIFVTKSNKEKPWLLFEAGALAKSVTNGRIIPIMLNLESSDLLANPLSQFQCANLEKKDILSVLRLILRNTENAFLEQEQLTISFETWWPKLESEIAAITPEKIASAKKASSEDRLQNLEKAVWETLREVRNHSIHSNPFNNNLGAGLFGNNSLVATRHGLMPMRAGNAVAETRDGLLSGVERRSTPDTGIGKENDA